MVTALQSIVLTTVFLAGCRFADGGVNEDAVIGPCPGAYCGCADTSSCAPACGLDGLRDACHLQCERLDECEASCGDECEASCDRARTCVTSCGDGCAASCEAAGECQFSCGHDCHVRCADVGHCRVEMKDGEAECERVGSCEVSCLGDDGVARPAEPAADGRFTCVAPSPAPLLQIGPAPTSP